MGRFHCHCRSPILVEVTGHWYRVSQLVATNFYTHRCPAAHNSSQNTKRLFLEINALIHRQSDSLVCMSFNFSSCSLKIFGLVWFVSLAHTMPNCWSFSLFYLVSYLVCLVLREVAIYIRWKSWSSYSGEGLEAGPFWVWCQSAGPSGGNFFTAEVFLACPQVTMTAW